VKGGWPKEGRQKQRWSGVEEKRTAEETNRRMRRRRRRRRRRRWKSRGSGRREGTKRSVPVGCRMNGHRAHLARQSEACRREEREREREREGEDGEIEGERR